MAKISTYPQPTPPQLDDYIIGTDISDLLMTKNFLLSDIITLATTTNQFVTIVGAQTVTGSKTFDYGTTVGVVAPVIINLPAQTQSISPDALLIQINGQVPSTTPGQITGINVQANFLDNICYFGTLSGNAGASTGIVIESLDAHSGNYLEFRKNLLGVPTIKFSVGSEGNTAISSNSGTVLAVSHGGILGTDIGINTSSYRGTGLQSSTYEGIAIKASTGGYSGIAVKAISTPGVGTALLTIGDIKTENLPTYFDNADAEIGGLPVDFIYKTPTGELRIVI
jgi:hypothetical protein